jgi:hypothetical protein
MLGSEVSLCIMTLLASYGTFARFIITKAVDNAPCREGTGWLESTTPNRKRSRT